jgi:hypothetical protein
MTDRKLGANRGNAGKGRPKGSPNKTTGTLKEAIAHVVDSTRDDCLGWLRAVAAGEKEGEPVLDDNGNPVLDDRGEPKMDCSWLRRPEPATALKLWGDLSEFLQPKLARTEHVGDNGGAIQVKGTIEFVSPIPRPVS